MFSSCEVRLLIERARKNAEMAPFNSNGGANEETLTLAPLDTRVSQLDK